jgi:membrane-associated protease RseP (regulator of RpoE activity)
MKALFFANAFAMLMPFTVRADSTPTGPVHGMEPYTVKESPFGFLGIKHAYIGMNPLKFIVGLDSIAVFQINELDPMSPAIAAGIKPGDRVISINGVSITKFSVAKLRRIGEHVEVGQKFELEVQRPSDNSTATMEVIVIKKPSPPRSPVDLPPPATVASPLPQS